MLFVLHAISVDLHSNEREEKSVSIKEVKDLGVKLKVNLTTIKYCVKNHKPLATGTSSCP
jgi:hypothetical protein